MLKRRLWPEFERQESLLILSTSNLTLQSDINSKTPKSTFHGSPRPLKLNNEPFKMFGSWVIGGKSNATFRVKIFFFNPVHGIREAPQNFLHFLDISINSLWSGQIRYNLLTLVKHICTPKKWPDKKLLGELAKGYGIEKEDPPILRKILLFFRATLFQLLFINPIWLTMTHSKCKKGLILCQIWP